MSGQRDPAASSFGVAHYSLRWPFRLLAAGEALEVGAALILNPPARR
jgi:hypothetical protein